MAEAVVLRALVSISKHGVGFGALLEALFRRRIGVAVRMKLQRQLAIGALDLLLRRGAAHAEHFVIIAFSVASQRNVPAPEFLEATFADGAPRAPWRAAAGGLSSGTRAASRQ